MHLHVLPSQYLVKQRKMQSNSLNSSQAFATFVLLSEIELAYANIDYYSKFNICFNICFNIAIRDFQG